MWKQITRLLLWEKTFPTPLEKAAAENLRSSEKVCKETYHIIVKRKTSSPVKSQEKWLSEDIFSNVQVNWENAYQLPFYIIWKQNKEHSNLNFCIGGWLPTFLLKRDKKETDSCYFGLIPQRHLCIFLGTVDQPRLFGIMFRSGPLKIFFWLDSQVGLTQLTAQFIIGLTKIPAHFMIGLITDTPLTL